MADTFVTGYRPKETLEQLVSRLNANSPIAKDVPVTGQEKYKERRTRYERLADRIQSMTAEQKAELLALLGVPSCS